MNKLSDDSLTNSFPMAVIMGDKRDVYRMTDIISADFNSIRLLTSEKELNKKTSWFSPRLVVVTEAFPGGINQSFIKKVKKKLNPEKVICLVNNISRKKEIELRSTGLAFLGSYREFFNNAEVIVNEKN